MDVPCRRFFNAESCPSDRCEYIAESFRCQDLDAEVVCPLFECPQCSSISLYCSQGRCPSRDRLESQEPTSRVGIQHMHPVQVLAYH